MKEKIWLDIPEEHDYPAAIDYLELVVEPFHAKQIVQKLRYAEMTTKKAKDILRASGLFVLPKKNVHVKSNIKKVKNGEKLSPVLLCVLNGKLVIADGFHRVCSIYYLSQDLEIPCKLVYHAK